MSQKSSSSPIPIGKRTQSALEHLMLDEENPRFGRTEGKSSSQADILDHIVEKFGVDDVLSSLAVNGYFEAEPLVCRRSDDDKFNIVIEGNRRLAACLILTADKRASHQARRTEEYQAIWRKHGSKTIDPLPIILFDKEKDGNAMLSYLGVRHIASAQPWDSYAKAAWVADVIEKNKIRLADVALMIGDQHQTISRMLEGYYFIHQLIETGNFRPEDSVRKGRGSVSEYPFSWVYTILGYSSVRKFLDLPDGEPKSSPIKVKNLNNASLVTKSMFGDKSKGKSAAISDSRELSDLASTFANPEKVALLEDGKTVEEIIRLTKPIEERLRQGLSQVRTIQADLLSGITEQGVSQEVAEPVVDLASKNRRSSSEIEKKLKAIVAGEGSDD